MSAKKRSKKRATAKPTAEARQTPESPPAAPQGEAELEAEPEAPALEPESGNGEAGAGELDELPEDALVLLAVRGMTLFPGVVLPIAVGRERSVRAIQAAARDGKPFGVLLQKNADVEAPSADELYQVGTVASIVRYLKAPDGSHHVIAQGEERFRVIEFLSEDPMLIARVERVDDPTEEELERPDIQARALALKRQAQHALELLPEKPEELDAAIQNTESPAVLADMIATFIELPAEEKQELLEVFDLEQRLDRVGAKLAHLTEVLQLTTQIQEDTRGKLDDAQREYYLREQLRTIEKELGEGKAPEIRELEEKIEAVGMPEEVAVEAKKELARLERMPEASAEHGMVRTYLDWMVELPWSVSTEDSIDLEKARQILDEDHHGLEKVKKRILEFLAVRKLKPEGKGPILCLAGPPGVGKTSLGQSVARAMGRKFVRVSLGGVHDEGEVRGHRRTYVGAMPGKIIQGLRKCGTNNPVFMLDEMDKLSASFHGDPSAALLEVLDPEQNSTFQDNYLGVDFDLSKAMFIGTANVLHQVPRPLRDRFEVIELPGYTEEEKLEIAKRYLVKRQTEAHGLKRKQLRLSVKALREIVRHYTREAGCRNLEREIAAVARHVATRVASGEEAGMKVDASDLSEILGPHRFESELALRTSVAGVATGLAWTPVGGDVLFIEATSMAGRGQLILTGQLGDVMKESARAAHSLVKSRAEDLSIDVEALAKRDLHVHLPAGAIPKDGPSAGVGLYTALVSLLTDRKVKSTVAMTGEISLRGLVLPVGGIKEKLLAAYRAGIQTVILPARNEKDLEDVPEHARAKLDFVFAEDVDEVLAVALETPKKRKRR